MEAEDATSKYCPGSCTNNCFWASAPSEWKDYVICKYNNGSHSHEGTTRMSKVGSGCIFPDIKSEMVRKELERRGKEQAQQEIHQYNLDEMFGDAHNLNHSEGIPLEILTLLILRAGLRRRKENGS